MIRKFINMDDEIVSKTLVQLSSKNSNVWRFFKKIGKDRDVVERAACNFCNHEYKIGRNPETKNSYLTSHLNRHIVSCKPYSSVLDLMMTLVKFMKKCQWN
ncbi:hypothetical protein S83_012756 [Arachis hypogaea]